jgi:hypothetical protein
MAIWRVSSGVNGVSERAIRSPWMRALKTSRALKWIDWAPLGAPGDRSPDEAFHELH